MCEEFNVSEVAGVTAMQCAESLVKNLQDMQEINEISLYRKYNRMRNGCIEVHGVAPNINKPLFNLDGSQVALQELVYLDSSVTTVAEPLPSVVADACTASTTSTASSTDYPYGDHGICSYDRPYVIIAASRS